MGWLSGIKQVVYKADLLYSGSLLRVKGEPEHKTLLGGILSISVIILLVAAFYNKVIDTLDKVIITSSSSSTNADDPESFNLTTIGKGPFMFGVEVWHHNLNSGSRYFDIVLTSNVFHFGQPTNASKQYKLEPCTLQHWNGFPDIQKDFDKLNMTYWKCLPKDTDFQIKGKYASEESKTLSVAVKVCTNRTDEDRSCAPQTEIDSFFANTSNNFFTIYFVNPLINPDNPDYLQYYLQDVNYIIFSKNGGGEGLLFVQDFSIQTDQSILPNTNIETVSGGIVTNSAIKNSYSLITDTYVTFFFYKSPTSLSITRSFQKLDNVLSYIGGLFGTIIILFFIIGSYNTYKFQVNLAGYLYRCQREEERVQKDYNFLYFIGQGVYALLDLMNFHPKWQKISRYHKIRQEMLKQLDILYLLKRINFIENSFSLLFSESQLKGMHLTNQPTMQEAIKTRRNYRLKSRLKNEFDATEKSHIIGHSQLKASTHLSNKANNNSIGNFDFQGGNLPKSFEKKHHHQVIDHSLDADFYSSDQSSQQSGGQQILDKIQHLRRQHQNSLSVKIWQNIDNRIKSIVEKIGFKNSPIQFQSEERNLQNIGSIKPIQINDCILNRPPSYHQGEQNHHNKCQDYAKLMLSKLKTVKIKSDHNLNGQNEQQEKYSSFQMIE